jgi:hypothetical protein
MITALAIALLIIFAGLVVMMAITPMVAESEARKSLALHRPAKRQRPEAVSPRWEHHQHAA